jgi:acyl dehydratase
VADQPFRIVAQNLPEHARNPIHTDAGAQAAGFPAALVAGVTSYAYLTHPLVVRWGIEWVASGSATVRFHRPLFAGDLLTCEVGEHGVTGWVSAPDDRRVEVTARRPSAGRNGEPESSDGEALQPLTVTLDGEFGSGYGERAGDDFCLYRDHGIVHPAVWPALANNVVHEQLAQGSWVHTRSTIRHHRAAREGAQAAVFAQVRRRFSTRHGNRAVLDVRVEVDGETVATLEHEALISLAGERSDR